MNPIFLNKVSIDTFQCENNVFLLVFISVFYRNVNSNVYIGLFKNCIADVVRFIICAWHMKFCPPYEMHVSVYCGHISLLYIINRQELHCLIGYMRLSKALLSLLLIIVEVSYHQI